MNIPIIDKPYAREYRSIFNAKKRGVSKYLLCGVDRQNNIYVSYFTCPQESYTHGTVNIIPQTGLFRVVRGSAVAGKEPAVSFPVEHVAIIDATTGVTSTSPLAHEVEILLFGLEFDKMRSDRALFSGGSGRYVELPLQRTVEIIGRFLGGNPDQHIDECFKQLSKYWYTPQEGRIVQEPHGEGGDE